MGKGLGQGHRTGVSPEVLPTEGWYLAETETSEGKAGTGLLANSPLPPGRLLLISAPTFEG